MFASELLIAMNAPIPVRHAARVLLIDALDRIRIQTREGLVPIGNFVTRKISRAVARIAAGEQDPLRLRLHHGRHPLRAAVAGINEIGRAHV